MIIEKGWDGRYILVHEATNIPVKMDEEVAYHNVKMTCEGGLAPHKPGSTGRIWMRPMPIEDGVKTHQNEWYPSVCDMRWLSYGRVE
jgi:hypothetical protein